MKFYLLQEMFAAWLSVAILFGAGLLVLVVLILLRKAAEYGLYWAKAFVVSLALMSFRRPGPGQRESRYWQF
jgi:hypothetical protein